MWRARVGRSPGVAGQAWASGHAASGDRAGPQRTFVAHRMRCCQETGKEMSCGRTAPAYRVDQLLAFATALFRRAGLDPDKAATVAEILVEGTCSATPPMAWRSAPYFAALEAGSMTRDGEPAVGLRPPRRPVLGGPATARTLASPDFSQGAGASGLWIGDSTSVTKT